MFPSVDEARSFVYRGLRQLLSSGVVVKDFRGHYRLVLDCGGLSAAEWDTCWMAVRYAVGGQSISTSLLPFELLSAYWRRWSVGEKARLLSILNDHLESVRRLTGKSEEESGRYLYTCSLHNFRVKAQAVCGLFRRQSSNSLIRDAYPTLF